MSEGIQLQKFLTLASVYDPSQFAIQAPCFITAKITA